MNNFRAVLQGLRGKTILDIQIHQSAPDTLYGVTIITTDGDRVMIGEPDVDENIQVWLWEKEEGGK